MTDYLGGLLETLRLRQQLQKQRNEGIVGGLGTLSNTFQNLGNRFASQQEAAAQRTFQHNERLGAEAAEAGENKLERDSREGISAAERGSREGISAAETEMRQKEIDARNLMYQSTPEGKTAFDREMALAAAGRSTGDGESAGARAEAWQRARDQMDDYIMQKAKNIQGMGAVLIDWTKWTQADTDAVMQMVENEFTSSLERNDITQAEMNRMLADMRTLLSLPTESADDEPIDTQITRPPPGGFQDGGIANTSATEQRLLDDEIATAEAAQGPEGLALRNEVREMNVNREERPWISVLENIQAQLKGIPGGTDPKIAGDISTIQAVIEDIKQNRQTSYAITGTNAGLSNRLKELLRRRTGKETP